jgi:hypothetical protein
MRQVRRFDPQSVMKISAIIYGLLGLVEGVVISIVALLGLAARSGSNGFPPTGALFGVFAIVLFPILGAVIGAICGGLGAVIYNVAARWVGGIHIEVSDVV